ncbi:MAG: hypothetical protein QXG39_00100 [Candidatus Aenigmatarchaeota archaeon]
MNHLAFLGWGLIRERREEMAGTIGVRKVGDWFIIAIKADKIYVYDEDLSGYTFLYIDRLGQIRGFKGREGISEFVSLKEAKEILERALTKLF